MGLVDNLLVLGFLLGQQILSCISSSEKTSLTFIGKAPHRVQHNNQLAEMSTVICTPSGLRDVFARMQVQASQNLKGLQHSAGSSRK